MFNLVCVGYDGSPTSDHAVDWAAAESERRGAVLRIVSCYEVPWAGPESGMTLDPVRMLLTRTDAHVAVTAARAVADHPASRCIPRRSQAPRAEYWSLTRCWPIWSCREPVGRVRTLRRQLGTPVEAHNSYISGTIAHKANHQTLSGKREATQ